MPSPHADAFREMANRIEKNDDADFSGAFVMVMPDGTVKQFLLLNPTTDLAMFLGTLKAQVDIAVREAAEA